jgi:hypothetical protein
LAAADQVELLDAVSRLREFDTPSHLPDQPDAHHEKVVEIIAADRQEPQPPSSGWRSCASCSTRWSTPSMTASRLMLPDPRAAISLAQHGSIT